MNVIIFHLKTIFHHLNFYQKNKKDIIILIKSYLYKLIIIKDYFFLFKIEHYYKFINLFIIL